MAHLRKKLWYALQLIVWVQFQEQINVIFGYQYQVGNLDAWGIPTSANPHVYTNWSKNQIFAIGDTLLFLYPPTQDSVIQVTEESYNTCNLKDPILYMNNGNSLFNITSPGAFYFTSGEPGHCQKSQKLHIFVSGNGSVSPAYGPTASAPSYPTVFGSIPAPPSSSASQSSGFTIVAAFGFVFCAFINGRL